MKQKRIITEDFFIGNLGDLSATNEILDAYFKVFNKNINNLTEKDYKASIASDRDSIINEKIRKCHASSMVVSDNNFIENGLRKIIKNINDMIWKISLDDEWESNIQFLKYIGKGEHFNWHKDFYEDHPEHGIGIRKLSIVYCLSKKSDYTGGEFQIRTSNNGVYTSKFDFGDFIVFPSDKTHRVKPLKSGTRITMVGWYR